MRSLSSGWASNPRWAWVGPNRAATASRSAGRWSSSAMRLLNTSAAETDIHGTGSGSSPRREASSRNSRRPECPASVVAQVSAMSSARSIAVSSGRCSAKARRWAVSYPTRKTPQPPALTTASPWPASGMVVGSSSRMRLRIGAPGWPSAGRARTATGTFHELPIDDVVPAGTGPRANGCWRRTSPCRVRSGCPPCRMKVFITSRTGAPLASSRASHRSVVTVLP